MISQTTEYALRAVVYLAQHASRSWTTRQVAAATRVPAGYLSKVLQSLSKAGLIESQRGRHGGFRLAREADQLTVLDVVNAVEPIQRIESCPLKLGTHDVNLCPLHKKLDDTIALVEKSFAETTVSELLADEDEASTPLCDAPVPLRFRPRPPAKTEVR